MEHERALTPMSRWIRQKNWTSIAVAWLSVLMREKNSCSYNHVTGWKKKCFVIVFKMLAHHFRMLWWASTYLKRLLSIFRIRHIMTLVKNKETYVKKRCQILSLLLTSCLAFRYLWLLYLLTAELFRFSPSKTSTQIRLLIKKKLRGTEHGNRCCRHHWQCTDAKYF